MGSLKRIISQQLPSLGARGRRKKGGGGNYFLYHQIPIQADFGQFAQKQPGYIEIDFVEHNGGLSSGLFAITAVYLDLYSQWIVRVAGLGKNLKTIKKIDQLAHQRIIYPILHYHPDNAKPILKTLWQRVNQAREEKEKKEEEEEKRKGRKRTPGIIIPQLSRSRPYRKNDNAHVEQKNNDKVRKLVGYCRYDQPEEVSLLNQLYYLADLIDNFFIPSFKLKRKVKAPSGRVIRKIYSPPQTPYQRLINSPFVSPSLKKRLRLKYQSLNLVELQQKKDQLLKQLWAIQKRKP